MSEPSAQSSGGVRPSASPANADWLLRHPRFAISAWTILVLVNGIGAAIAEDGLTRGLKVAATLGFAFLLIRTVRMTRAQQSPERR